MRNVISALVAGLLLSGCLGDEEADFDGSQSTDTSGNSAPTISGRAPSAIMYGNRYEFVPDADDPDGDTLTFSVSNLPTWASFDTGTGRISGRPTLSDIGVHDSIRISVSDGSATAALPEFSVTVRQTALGSVTLSWNAPTQNMDGSPLTDLAGYRIYYGTRSGAYDYEVEIDNPSVMTYVLDELDPATYYIAATAYNTSGIESSFSSEISRSVN